MNTHIDQCNDDYLNEIAIAMAVAIVIAATCVFGWLLPSWYHTQQQACETQAAREQAADIRMLERMPYSAEASAHVQQQIESTYQGALKTCRE